MPSSDFYLLLIEPVWNRNFYMGYPHFVLLKLLIEPVWNRNVRSRFGEIDNGALLIEPVWNRNNSSFIQKLGKLRLLIEPVWNRNLLHPPPGSAGGLSFNRTSMESKRYPPVDGSHGHRLLIEPVWNRNSIDVKKPYD